MEDSHGQAPLTFDEASGTYYVRGKAWAVGSKYILHQHIGAGSYGDVCRATDKETGEVLALKRVADVLCCPMLAKRVLREVCIMRRLSHPYVIRLADVFTRKSTEVAGGVDLYIATEFAAGGDLYRLKEPLFPQDVQLLMWQLLVGTRYLHSCHVWHRDVKSENTLLLANRTVKICDFGLARSALGVVEAGNHSDVTSSPLLRPQKMLKRQFTKMVVTPSYRAPEVVMSRGQYTSAIDMWSLGCIFWELLQRQMSPQRVGPPSRPLFGVRGDPATPARGEQYVDDNDSPLADQLDVIFDVIGTPCWRDIQNVPSDNWRAYLKRLPGRAGNLAAQMAACGDREAVDLLSRLLAFDPSRRCSAEEALAHAYFDSLQKPMEIAPMPIPSEEEASVNVPGDYHFWQISDPAVALGLLEKELVQSTHEPDGGRKKLEWLLEREAEGQQLQNFLRNSMLKSLLAARASSRLNAATAAAVAAAASSPRNQAFVPPQPEPPSIPDLGAAIPNLPSGLGKPQQIQDLSNAFMALSRRQAMLMLSSSQVLGQLQGASTLQQQQQSAGLLQLAAASSERRRSLEGANANSNDGSAGHAMTQLQNVGNHRMLTHSNNNLRAFNTLDSADQSADGFSSRDAMASAAAAAVLAVDGQLSNASYVGNNQPLNQQGLLNAANLSSSSMQGNLPQMIQLQSRDNTASGVASFGNGSMDSVSSQLLANQLELNRRAVLNQLQQASSGASSQRREHDGSDDRERKRMALFREFNG